MLDAGFGQGHWTRALAPHLAAGTSITGIDRDPAWASARYEWQAQFAQRHIDVSIRQADVYALPYADATFDLVTCQTLMIHLARPRHALAEMLRVLAPHGLLLCVEPDNFGTSPAKSSQGDAEDPDTLSDAFRFALTQQRGRVALGLLARRGAAAVYRGRRRSGRVRVSLAAGAGEPRALSRRAARAALRQRGRRAHVSGVGREAFASIAIHLPPS